MVKYANEIASFSCNPPQYLLQTQLNPTHLPTHTKVSLADFSTLENREIRHATIR